MLFRLARTALLNKMHVAGPCPSSALAGDGWLETSFSTGKTCTERLCSTRQVGYVCACLCVCLPFSSLFLCSDLWPFLCTASCISPPRVPEYSALESAISCLIIVVLCRALPVPAGTRNKFPSTRLHAELPFPATALLCHRLPGEYMAWTISLFSAHGLLILTVHLFFGLFLKKKYRYVSLCTCMETLMDLYEWRQRKKEPTRRWRCGREMARGQTTGRKCPYSLLASSMGMKEFNMFKLNKICFKS